VACLHDIPPSGSKAVLTLRNFPQVSAECRDLISRMLTVDPRHRISVADIQRHPWFQQDLPVGTLEVNAQLQQTDSARCLAPSVKSWQRFRGRPGLHFVCSHARFRHLLHVDQGHIRATCSALHCSQAYQVGMIAVCAA